MSEQATRTPVETSARPGRGPLRPSYGARQAPPAEPWGSSPEARRWGIPDIELGRAVVIEMARESDTENYDLLSRYGAVVERAYEAKALAFQRRAVDEVVRIYLGTVAA